MKWSWRIATAAGIGIYVHVTFLILLAWVGMSSYLARQRWEDVLAGVIFITLLFLIVVLHELGHALTARRYGIGTRDITLLPIGGVARLERMPSDPKQELAVALAGPAVNVVLAALLFSVLIGVNQFIPIDFSFATGGLFTKLMWINVMLALFNMLPAFPMDGGRVLRALLAVRLSYVRATQIAANIGQGMALLFGFVGLFYNPFLVFIALFVWMGAAQEASQVQMKSALEGVPVSKVMVTEFSTLQPHDPLSRAVEHIISGFQHDFPVTDDGQVVGVLTRADLLAALANNGQFSQVQDVMKRKFETAAPQELAEDVFTRLQDCDCRSMPVLSEGQLRGIMTLENIGEYMMIQAALRGERSRSALAAAQQEG